MTNQEILNRLNAGSNEEHIELDADYDLTADGRAVPSGDESGVVVFGGKGKKIPKSLAKELGLLDKPKVEAIPDEGPGSEKSAAADEPEQKAVRQAEVEDKAVHKTTKGSK